MKDPKELVSQMTLEEKAGLCSGEDFWTLKSIERLGIPRITVTDGPHGLRMTAGDTEHPELMNTIPATCFPTASALAATWNRDLIFEVGQALAEECKQEKVGVILGPGINIKRTPLCGRNFEYFSEDPYLNGQIAASHIQGVQSLGIGTSLKHYAANNQDYRRMTIDAVVDERALREIYLAGFEAAVKEAQPWTLMCAYNHLNGTYACEHPWLLTTLLKEEWGHEGIVMTDWGAMNDRVESLKAGLELEMPGTNRWNDDQIVAAVRNGDLDIAVLDSAAERVVALILKAEETLKEDYKYDPAAHHALARKTAGEGAVLLKNESSLLPLDKQAKIAVIGVFAKQPRYQGAGSSLMNPTRLDNLYDEMVKLAGEEHLSYAEGYRLKGVAVDETLLAEAVENAKEADTAVLCIGLPGQFEAEGVDREHMRLPDSHNALVNAILAANPNTVVVLINGTPVEMPWADHAPAILEGYLGGQAGGGALADILYGDVNPSGKLAESFPVALEDNSSDPFYPGGPAVVEYRESIYVGYRYYDSANVEVLFPFGHGLSYTSFEYSDLKLNKTELTDADSLQVSLKVRNPGAIAGKETVQVYVRDPESTVFKANKELKGFAKVELLPGEEQEVTITLQPRAFAYYNLDMQQWHIESGTYEILAGASSRDIRLQAEVTLLSSQPPAPQPDRDKLAVYYQPEKIHSASREAFEELLGRNVPPNEIEAKGHYTINTVINDMQSVVGRLIKNYANKQVDELIKGIDRDDPTAIVYLSMAKEAPLRTMLMIGGEMVTRPLVDALLLLINGKFFRGLVALVKTLLGK